MITLSSRKRVHCEAFTLIELLVVVAIIALLLSILLPSLRRARVQAKRVVCGANLNQLAKAWIMYLDDSGGQFPQGVNLNINYGGQQGAGLPSYRVPKPLNRYLGLPAEAGTFLPGAGRVREQHEAEVFRCPADEGGDNIRPSHFEYYGTSYQTNVMLIGPDRMAVEQADPVMPVLRKVNKRLPGISTSKATTNPSLLILMGDYGWPNTWWYSSIKRFEWHDAPCSHNLAFLDGHVSFTRVRKGLHYTADYITIPFDDLAKEASQLQQEVECN
jgi:prepilin-type N-terminal cleavage/methylation domain-containing protein/prepilin-type processing-associated H-X9-DG protein